MITKRKRNKKVIRWTFVTCLVLLISYLAVNTDRWYMDTTGPVRQEILVTETEVTGKEYSLTELQAMEQVRFNQSLMLINTDYMLPEDFVAETEEYRDSGVNMNSCITEAYGELSDAVKEIIGDNLFVSSGIRDKEHQQKLYEEQPDTATIPGASEHETGLCMDVYVACYAGDSFLNSKAGKFVNEHCDEYGFIIRYPSYGEEETGIRFEPWHIRYVGFPHSEIIYNNSLTLEEYIFSLKEDVCYEAEGYLILRQKEKEGKLQIPADCKEYVVSPDNTGCYIITGKK